MKDLINDVKRCEIEAIECAKNGKPYEYIMAEMSACTDKLLSLGRNFKAKKESLVINKEVCYKEITSPSYAFYQDIELGDTVRIKEFRNYTVRALQGVMATALNRFNHVNGKAYAFESHMKDNELILTRVG